MKEYIEKIKKYFKLEKWNEDKIHLLSLEEKSYEERKSQYGGLKKEELHKIIKSSVVAVMFLIVGIILSYLFPQQIMIVLLVDFLLIVICLVNGLANGFNSFHNENEGKNIEQIRYRQRYKIIREKVLDETCNIDSSVCYDENYDDLIFGSLKGKAKEYWYLNKMMIKDEAIELKYGEVCVVDDENLKNVSNNSYIKYRGMVYEVSGIKTTCNIGVVLRESIETNIEGLLELKFNSSINDKYFAYIKDSEVNDKVKAQKYLVEKIEPLMMKLKAENRLIEIAISNVIRISVEDEVTPRYEGNYFDGLTFVNGNEEFIPSNYEDEYIEDIKVGLIGLQIAKDLQ